MLTRLFLALFLLFAAGLAAAQDTRNLQVGKTGEKRIALVIGNSDYTQSPLKNPVNDARAMRARLEGLGFEVILKENLKTRDISGVYREFRNKITPGGVALVFYAGHGLQFKGQNYFPAIDSDINFEEEVPLQSLNLGNLLDNMEEAKAGVSLVFLDACRDNPFARKFRSASRGLAKVEAASGTLIHYATKPGSVAADGDGLNGTYTEALLAQLGEVGVPVEQMLKKVTNRVAQKTGGKQEPWVEGSLRGEFYFIFQGPTTVNVQQTPADPDSSAWQAAESMGTLPAYEAYLKEYPQGRHAAAARIKIGALKAPARPAAVLPAPTFTPQASSDPETAFWNEVKASGNKDYLDAYLKQYPKGKFAALARLELKKLDDQDKAQKEQADQDVWDRAKTDNTPAAYQSYLERYPTGRYAALAGPAKQKAEREQMEREKAEREKAEREMLEQERRKQLSEQTRREAEERIRREEASRGPQWAESDNGADVSWSEATAYCESKGSGWRLPTSSELQENYRLGRSTPCGSLGGVPYTCKISSNSHLSSPVLWTNSEGWYVGLVGGNRHAYSDTYQNSPRALCLRDR